MKELAIHYTGWFHVDCAEPYGKGGWFLVLQQHGRTRVYRRDDTDGGWKKGREIPLKRDLYSLAGRTHNPACGFTLTNFEVDFFEGLSLEAQP
ncbi:MAG: hypothetical protein VXY51_10455 [Pseudomonadota bacterium]|nr:hypothetical protein [Pseudomonadota bacterium]MEC8550492.1 hypothetical protein [Pseudomonadota bacterium]